MNTKIIFLLLFGIIFTGIAYYFYYIYKSEGFENINYSDNSRIFYSDSFPAENVATPITNYDVSGYSIIFDLRTRFIDFITDPYSYQGFDKGLTSNGQDTLVYMNFMWWPDGGKPRWWASGPPMDERVPVN